MLKLYTTLFLICLPTLVCYAQSQQDQKIVDSLIAEIAIAKNDSIKLQLYNSLLWRYFAFNPHAGLQYEKDALAVAERMNNPQRTADIKMSIGRLYWKAGKFEQALQYHFEVLKINETIKDDKRIAETLSQIGQDYADQGNYDEALKYFELALRKFQELNNKEGEAGCYLLIAFVYSTMGNVPAAAKANYEALKIYESLGNTYAVAVSTANLADEYMKMEKFDDALTYYKRSAEAMLAANDRENYSGIHISIGEVYRNTGNPEKALEYYLMALDIGRQINNAMCIGQAHEYIARLYFAQGTLDSSLANYLIAENMYQSIANKPYLATVCNQIGIIYLRLHQLTTAEFYLEKSIRLANEVNNPSIFMDYYLGIQTLDSIRGNWQDAYFNFRQYIVYRDSVESEANAKSTMQTVMQHEFDKKEAAAKAEQEKKDLKQRNFRNSILAGLAGSIFFLIVVYRQRNKVAKARKRSDELLLNILPSEVAEELKEKGSAEAKHFDNVTVMFTDFKGFTKISEKLSPVELVREIHTCFKAFDEIISTHNIEKIKTIGDSYMCAGGLPVPNSTHAENVVQAALEIQQFMFNHIRQREKENKEIFEIRIGVHSGPVVAGIVGLKKFAYDIWGDTVNIASRMESSGEEGKVNISGATFDLVKDKFHCTYRGKIEAKNKGEIDMYFAEAK